MAAPADAADRLLAEASRASDACGRILAIEGGSGLLLESLARPGADVLFHNSDCDRHSGAMARLSGMPPAATAGMECLLGDLPRAALPYPSAAAWPDSPEFPSDSFGAVFYRLGKGTAALHAAVREAFHLLRPGGSLFISGHTREGIKSLAERTEGHFGNAELMDIKASCRLLRFRKTASVPTDPLPDPDYFAPVALALEVPSLGSLAYVSKPGIFAYRATDPGTALLARHLGDMTGLRVLDLGCGSGVLALAAARLGAREVVATDSSAVAVAVARRNLAGVDVPARVLCTHFADGLEGGFDLVISNPPFHRGGDTDYSLPGRVLGAILPHLAPAGRVLLVANQFLDYPREAQGRFASCEVLTRENGYRVIRLTC